MKSICQSCDHEIQWTGEYWKHVGISPRHIAKPKPSGLTIEATARLVDVVEEEASGALCYLCGEVAFIRQFRPRVGITLDKHPESFEPCKFIICQSCNQWPIHVRSINNQPQPH